MEQGRLIPRLEQPLLFFVECSLLSMQAVLERCRASGVLLALLPAQALHPAG